MGVAVNVLQVDLFLVLPLYDQVGMDAVFVVVFGEVVEFENEESVPKLFSVGSR